MVFEWRTGKSPFWEMAVLGILLLVISTYRFGGWALLGVLPVILVLFRFHVMTGRQQQFNFAEVTGWWWLPTHVVVRLGLRRLTIRRWEVSTQKYALLRRQLMENTSTHSG